MLTATALYHAPAPAPAPAPPLDPERFWSLVRINLWRALAGAGVVGWQVAAEEHEGGRRGGGG